MGQAAHGAGQSWCSPGYRETERDQSHKCCWLSPSPRIVLLALWSAIMGEFSLSSWLGLSPHMQAPRTSEINEQNGAPAILPVHVICR